MALPYYVEPEYWEEGYAEGDEEHVKKAYLYFAMGFSLFVELLNLRLLKRRKRSAPQSAAS